MRGVLCCGLATVLGFMLGKLGVDPLAIFALCGVTTFYLMMAPVSAG